jgi:aryl-alcohol dehydrogenase-like predicted oxidoreductase
MQSRQLGRDGPMIHPIGFGAMSFSDFYGATNQLESHAILDMALEAGVTHIDTSNVYGMGRSETVIGGYPRAESLGTQTVQAISSTIPLNICKASSTTA